MNFFQAMSLGWVPVATVADLQDSPLPPADHPGPDLKLDPPAELLPGGRTKANTAPRASQKQPPNAPVSWQLQNQNKLLIKDQKGGRGRKPTPQISRLSDDSCR